MAGIQLIYKCNYLSLPFSHSVYVSLSVCNQWKSISEGLDVDLREQVKVHMAEILKGKTRTDIIHRCISSKA